MGTKTTLTTNGEGRYVAPVLPPGRYQVEVTAQGFKKSVRNGDELRVGDRLDISLTLDVGAQDQSVTVTSDLPLLNSESASVGTVVDSQRVANLPLSYGNPFLLIGLTAGVTFNGSVRLDRPFEPTHIVNYCMGGTRGNLNDVTIDGAPTTATANANEVTASYVPPTDIVQEFKVQTATFDAQFGQTQGGVTSIIIKSGLPAPSFSFDRWGGPSAVLSAFPRFTTAATKPSSCGATRASRIPVRATTKQPTRSRRPPCTMETFPR